MKKFEDNDKNKGKEKENGNIRSDSNVKGHVETKHKLQVILAEISGHNAVSSNHYTGKNSIFSQNMSISKLHLLKNEHEDFETSSAGRIRMSKVKTLIINQIASKSRTSICDKQNGF